MGEYARNEYLRVHNFEVRPRNARPTDRRAIETRLPGGGMGTKHVPAGPVE